MPVFVPLVQAVVYPIVLDEALHLDALSLDSYKSCFHLRESAVAHDLKDVLRNLLGSKLLGTSLFPALPAPGLLTLRIGIKFFAIVVAICDQKQTQKQNLDISVSPVCPSADQGLFLLPHPRQPLSILVVE